MELLYSMLLGWMGQPGTATLCKEMTTEQIVWEVPNHYWKHTSWTQRKNTNHSKLYQLNGWLTLRLSWSIKRRRIIRIYDYSPCFLSSCWLAVSLRIPPSFKRGNWYGISTSSWKSVIGGTPHCSQCWLVGGGRTECSNAALCSTPLHLHVKPSISKSQCFTFVSHILWP